jgi:serpin B
MPSNQPTGTPAASPTTLDGIREVRAEVGRASAADAATRDAVVAADRDFAFRLYQVLAPSAPANLFYSPYSISTALSMTYAGAREQTARQLAEVLGIDVADSAWHAGRNALDLALSATRPVNGDQTPLTLEPTNGIFGQAGYPFEADFLRVLAADYGAGLQTVDYVGRVEAARALINAWVAQRTNDRIGELLPRGSIDEMTVLVLVNAIYFKGSWWNQFNAKATDRQAFNRLDGSQVQVDQMHATLESDYASGDGWQAVRLAYAGGASMTLIVPDAGRFAEIQAGLSGDFVAGVESALAGASVSLDLPRWSSASALDLVPPLKALGLTDIFDASTANLSGIAAVDQLYVSGVLHQANVSVDEQGTEAAAATAVVVGRTSLPAQQVNLNVDHPFIYLIRDDVTGEVLFVGRVLDPTAD